MTTCRRCLIALMCGNPTVNCPCQGQIPTKGRPSANAYRGAGTCRIGDDLAYLVEKDMDFIRTSRRFTSRELLAASEQKCVNEVASQMLHQAALTQSLVEEAGKARDVSDYLKFADEYVEAQCERIARAFDLSVRENSKNWHLRDECETAARILRIFPSVLRKLRLSIELNSAYKRTVESKENDGGNGTEERKGR